MMGGIKWETMGENKKSIGDETQKRRQQKGKGTNKGDNG